MGNWWPDSPSPTCSRPRERERGVQDTGWNSPVGWLVMQHVGTHAASKRASRASGRVFKTCIWGFGNPSSSGRRPTSQR